MNLNEEKTPTALTLCTDPDTWAEEFVKAHPDVEDNILEETGVTLEDISSWFAAAMETKRMMAIAAMPLPSRFGR